MKPAHNKLIKYQFGMLWASKFVQQAEILRKFKISIIHTYNMLRVIRDSIVKKLKKIINL